MNRVKVEFEENGVLKVQLPSGNDLEFRVMNNGLMFYRKEIARVSTNNDGTTVTAIDHRGRAKR